MGEKSAQIHQTEQNNTFNVLALLLMDEVQSIIVYYDLQ